jgi:hypothetical protein
VAQRLCEAGADPNARSVSGETPLALAKGKLRDYLAARA